ncbi:MAG: DedA family protein [Calditrichaeota bacterium]|nr:MAG: DedA family protein [Calditrichota bacterium]
MVRKIYDWVLKWAETPYGPLALAILAFTESAFFIIPPDVLLVALAVGKPKKSLHFALYCSVASVLGGMFGYYIGLGLWSVVSDLFFSYIPGFTPDKFEMVRTLYEENGFWVVFTAGFTPIPYKLFTITAGVFEINFFGFVLASLVGRSARFFLVGGLIWKFGEEIQEFIDKYFNLLAIVFTVLLIGGFFVVKYALH